MKSIIHATAIAFALAGTAWMLPSVSAQAPKSGAKPWVVPRTADGKPDLQGNWTNETQTPLERLGAQGATLTEDQAKAIEDPKVFTRPWKISMPLYRRQEKNVQLLEYECYAYERDERLGPEGTK